MVSEEKRKAVEKEAKQLMERFGKLLENVPSNKSKRTISGRTDRVEGNGKSCGNEFREAFLNAAPKRDEDCLIAEKASW